MIRKRANPLSSSDYEMDIFLKIVEIISDPQFFVPNKKLEFATGSDFPTTSTFARSFLVLNKGSVRGMFRVIETPEVLTVTNIDLYWDPPNEV